MPVLDTFERPLGSLRLSVTDRCNLRCTYCMPESDYVWLERDDLLRFEEIARVARVFAGLGVTKLRLTGGEPLLRRNLAELVRLLREVDGIEDLALTTNGVLLTDQAQALREAGLDRVTISLDTLRPDRFHELTRRDELGRTLEGIEAALRAGFENTKLNTVVMRGVNDDEMIDLMELGRERGLEVRFIEYMDVGGATRWSTKSVVSRAEILARLAARYGTPVPEGGEGSAPAGLYLLPDGTRFGVIASTTRPFCGSCDRSRLTADGRFYLCLYAMEGLDLRTPLRSGTTDEELAEIVTGRWRAREDRGAERRLASPTRSEFVPLEDLRADPHLEMHTRGG